MEFGPPFLSLSLPQVNWADCICEQETPLPGAQVLMPRGPFAQTAAQAALGLDSKEKLDRKLEPGIASPIPLPRHGHPCQVMIL